MKPNTPVSPHTCEYEFYCSCCGLLFPVKKLYGVSDPMLPWVWLCGLCRFGHYFFEYIIYFGRMGEIRPKRR